MAKYSIRFFDQHNTKNIEVLNVGKTVDVFFRDDDDILFLVEMDKQTAIKFSKSLRLEINKLIEREVTNG